MKKPAQASSLRHKRAPSQKPIGAQTSARRTEQAVLDLSRLVEDGPSGQEVIRMAQKAAPEMMELFRLALEDPFDDLGSAEGSSVERDRIRQPLKEAVRHMSSTPCSRWCSEGCKPSGCTHDLHRWLMIRYERDDVFSALKKDLRWKFLSNKMKEDVELLRQEISRCPGWCFRLEGFQLTDSQREQASRFQSARVLKETVVQPAYRIRPIPLHVLPDRFDYRYEPDADGRQLLAYSRPLPIADDNPLRDCNLSPQLRVLQSLPVGDLLNRRLKITVDRVPSKNPDVPDLFAFRSSWVNDVPPERRLESQLDLIALIAGSCLYYTRLTPRHFLSALRSYCEKPELFKPRNRTQVPLLISPASKTAPPDGSEEEDQDWTVLAAELWNGHPDDDIELYAHPCMSFHSRYERLNLLVSLSDDEFEQIPFQDRSRMTLDAIEFYNYVWQPRPKRRKYSQEEGNDETDRQAFGGTFGKRVSCVPSRLDAAVKQLYDAASLSPTPTTVSPCTP